MTNLKISSLNMRSFRPLVLLGLAVFLVPLLTAYVPLSLATLLPVLLLFAVICRVTSGTPRFRLDKYSTVVLIAFIALAAASVSWSYSIELSWDKLPRTVIIVLLGVFLIAAMSGFDNASTHTLSNVFLAGIILTTAAIVIERIVGEILFSTGVIEQGRNHFLNTFNRPLSLLSIMLWPAVVLLSDRRPLYGCAAIVVCFALFSTFATGAATAAIAIGTVVFGAVYAAPRIMAPLVGIVLGVSVLLAPTINHVLPAPKAMFEQLNLPRSAYHRLLVWDFTSAKLAERPLHGWGFNTSRAIPGGGENLDASEPALPLHPHNAALQWRLELGVLGALLGAGLFVVAGLNAGRHGRNRFARAGATATMASAFCIGMLSFGAWQSWWISGLFIITGITVLVCRDVKQPTGGVGQRPIR